MDVGISLTVTSQVADRSPSLVVAVIVALPGDKACTRPVEFTLAMAGAEVDQRTEVSSALAGFTVATNCSDYPRSIVAEERLSVISVTGIGSGVGWGSERVTVTVHSSA